MCVYSVRSWKLGSHVTTGVRTLPSQAAGSCLPKIPSRLVATLSPTVTAYVRDHAADTPLDAPSFRTHLPSCLLWFSCYQLGVPLGLLFDLLIGAVPQCDFHSLATLGKAVDSNSERCVCVCAGAWRVALWRVLGASEV